MSFDWYFDALDGKTPPVHEGDPQPGYFKIRDGRTKGWVPAWVDEGLNGFRGFDGDVRPIDAVEQWGYLCAHPVRYEAWIAAYEAGSWPEDVESDIAAARADHAAFTGSNAPADDREAMSDEIESALSAAREWLAAAGDPKIWDQPARDKCQNFRDRIATLSADAETKRKALKDPHIIAGREIDGAWTPLITKAKDAAGYLRDRLRDALKAERGRQAAAAAEAARIAEEARRAEGGAAPEQTASHEQTEPPKVLAGTTGRRSGLKARKVYRLTDARALITYLVGLPQVPLDLTDAAEKIGRKIAMNGVDVPGMTLDEILSELSATDETASVVVVVVSREGSVPSEVRTMATPATGLDLLAASGALLDLVETRADADTSVPSGFVAANCHIACVHVGLAVDALMTAAPRYGALS